MLVMMAPPSDIFEDEQALIARRNAHVLDAYVFSSGSISPSGYINLRCIKRPDNSFLLTDNEQNMICKMIPDDSTVHRRLKLFNKEETKILTFREAKGTAHGRWNAKDPSQKLLYSVCRTHMIQDEININLKVRIKKKRNKSGRNDIEYKVIGSALNNAFTVYEGISSTELARVFLDPSDVNKYMVEIDASKVKDCEYLLEIVFSVVGIVNAMKNPSMAKIIARRVASQLASGVALAAIGVGLNMAMVI